MNKIKIKHPSEIPEDYTGIVKYEYGAKEWCKNGELHREDGPAVIHSNGDKEWWLDGAIIWSQKWNKMNGNSFIILLKEQHPKYLTCQVWTFLQKSLITKKTIIPGMEKWFIT